ncbi:hypothetical protein D3C72_1880790 [compost metagenome]
MSGQRFEVTGFSAAQPAPVAPGGMQECLEGWVLCRFKLNKVGRHIRQGGRQCANVQIAVLVAVQHCDQCVALFELAISVQHQVDPSSVFGLRMQPLFQRIHACSPLLHKPLRHASQSGQ